MEHRYAVAEDLSSAPVETQSFRNSPGVANVGDPARNAFHQVECLEIYQPAVTAALWTRLLSLVLAVLAFLSNPQHPVGSPYVLPPHLEVPRELKVTVDSARFNAPAGLLSTAHRLRPGDVPQGKRAAGLN